MTSRKCLHISSIGRQVLVADATVGQGLPGRWNTPDGLKPTMLDYRAGADIYRPVRFSRMNILIDNRKVPMEEFTEIGSESPRSSVCLLYTNYKRR